MELLEVLITLPLRKQYLRVLLRELFLYQQLLILLQNLRPYIASGTASATGTINDVPQLATITLLRLPEGSPAV
jgi:hypothetical protein